LSFVLILSLVVSFDLDLKLNHAFESISRLLRAQPSRTILCRADFARMAAEYKRKCAQLHSSRCLKCWLHTNGKTPLHIAAGNGYVWGVKVLLESSADPSIKDKVDRSAAEYTKQRGKLDARDKGKRERMECVVALDSRVIFI